MVDPDQFDYRALLHRSTRRASAGIRKGRSSGTARGTRFFSDGGLGIPCLLLSPAAFRLDRCRFTHHGCYWANRFWSDRAQCEESMAVMGKRVSAPQSQWALCKVDRSFLSPPHLFVDEVAADRGRHSSASRRYDLAYTPTAALRGRPILAGLVDGGTARFDPATPQVLSALISALRDGSAEKVHLILTRTNGSYLIDGAIGRGEPAKFEGRYRELIAPALEHGAGGMVLIHTHPSGDPTPSLSDISVTRSLGAIANMLDILLLDHIVIGARSACSMRKAGLL